MLHLALHFIVPAVVVALFFRERWQKAYLVMLATMIVDIDHVVADPIYDPGRCSIGFHPFHEPWFIAIYIVLCFIPQTRLIGLGLTIHMALDSIDCQVNTGAWIHSSWLN